MFINQEALAAAASSEWDLIVVGAGAVGLMLAVSQARAHKRVLLLESGAAENDDAGTLNEIVMSGRPHLGATHGRARTLGGTTTLWGGQLTRFGPYDFDTREIMPDCNWPLRYEEVEGYYATAAGMLDLDMACLTDAAVQSRIRANKTKDAAGCEVFFTRWLRESNLARWFGRDLQDLPNLGVATQCHATEVLSGADGSQITGVRAVSRDGSRLDLQARNVALACGTIEISRLLLLTGRKNPHLTWARNANIGKYFQDHLDLVIGQIELKDKRAFADLFENVIIQGHKYQPKIKMRTTVLRELGCLNIACTVRFDSAIGEDIQLLKQFFKSVLSGSRVDKPLQSVKRMFRLGHVWLPLMWRYVRHRRILAMADRGISVIAHCEQRPLKESQITLDADRTDRFGDPLGKLQWAVDEPLQVRSLQQFGEQLRGYLRGGCDAELKLDQAIVQGDRMVLNRATDSYHQCGGARMASSESEGVVNSNCRVFGTKNLFVAGAAVFPSSSFANPTFTAMALACRLSGHLNEARAV
jgi:choline dehydrogenase-like flavoprotein